MYCRSGGMVDAHDSKSCLARGESSSLSSGTKCNLFGIKNMERLFSFIKSQKIMAIATRDGEDIWIANVYANIDKNNAIYFISSENTRHCQMMLKNPNVVFSFAWSDEENPENRKGVQGRGVCRKATGAKEISTGLILINKKFPVFSKIFTTDWIHTNKWKEKVWILKPTYVKYWDDEKYGDNESEEFTFGSA